MHTTHQEIYVNGDVILRSSIQGSGPSRTIPCTGPVKEEPLEIPILNFGKGNGNDEVRPPVPSHSSGQEVPLAPPPRLF